MHVRVVTGFAVLIVVGLLVAGALGGLWSPAPDATPRPASAPASAYVTTMVPADIPADCSTDVTASLQRWIDAQPDGTAGHPRVLDLGGGCFGLGSAAPGVRGAGARLGPRNGLLLIGRKHLALRGTGRLLALGDAARDGGVHVPRAAVWIENSADITIAGADRDGDGRIGPAERLRVEGANSGGGYDPRAGREHDHGIRILGGERIDVAHLAISRTWGDGVYVGPGPNISGVGPAPWGPRGEGATPATQITVRDSEIRSSGRHAVSCVGCDTLTVQRNRFRDAGYWVIDLEQQLPLVPIRGIQISDNDANGARYGFAAVSAAGDAPDGVTRVTIARNRFSRSETCLEFVSINAGAGPSARPATRDITLSDNEINVNQHAILARNVAGLSVSGNRGRTRTHLRCTLPSRVGLPDRFALVVALPGVGGLRLRDNTFDPSPGDESDIRTTAVVRVADPPPR